MADESHEKSEIAFFTTDELIAELAIRSEVLVIGLIPKTHAVIKQEYIGGRVACRGLMLEMADYARAEAEMAHRRSRGET